MVAAAQDVPALRLPDAVWAAVQAAAAGEPWPPASDAAADKLMAQAAGEGLLPLLFAAPDPPEVVARARERHRALWALAEARAQILVRALREVAGVLTGEPFVVLKGADYMMRLYPRPALRPMQDLDLLVPAGRLDAAGERLLAGGLRRRPPARRARQAASYYERTFLLGDVVVEVHQAFLQRSRHPIDYAAVWARRQPWPELSADASRLDPVDAVAYHALAIAKDEFSVPLVRYVDFWLMLRQAPELLAPAAARAREWRAGRAFYGVLHQARLLFPDLDTEGARALGQELEGPLARGFLRRFVLPPPSEWGRAGVVTRARQLWRKFWLLDNAGRRVAFAVDHARSALRARRPR